MSGCTKYSFFRSRIEYNLTSFKRKGDLEKVSNNSYFIPNIAVFLFLFVLHLKVLEIPQYVTMFFEESHEAAHQMCS